METRRAIPKTGEARALARQPWPARAATGWLLALALAGWPASVRADDEVAFTATVDREQVSVEESVTLRMSIRAEGNLQVGEPQLKAPEFEVVNEYTGTFVESYYDNGRFGMPSALWQNCRIGSASSRPS